MSQPEDTLIAAAQAGNQDAMETLLKRHLSAVHAFVRLRAGPMIRGKESSLDIVQSVCREALQGLANFRHGGQEGFRQWLLTAVVRKLADRDAHYHAQKRDVAREAHPAPGAGSDADRDLLDAYATFVSPSRQAMVREEIARVERAFAELEDDHREVITLARIVGLSHAEIALRLDRSEGAVRKLLFRALRVLAEKLDRPVA
jgi:RNA polymerase sigma-70 factor, ECF subfamily